MKTVLEGLEKAKEQGYEWADAAIRNYDPNYAIRNEVKSLHEAIRQAFKWEGSPEGHSFWINIYRTIESQVAPSLTDLVARYEAARLGLDRVLPDKSLREPHRTASYAAYMASYQEDMKEVIEQIAKALGIEQPKERKLIGWVVVNTIDMVYLIGKPEKVKAGWSLTKPLTPEEAIALCGRLPQWTDDEPTPVYEK